eukprot:4137320-Pleurochrysis_carterae.AAC.4
MRARADPCACTRAPTLVLERLTRRAHTELHAPSHLQGRPTLLARALSHTLPNCALLHARRRSRAVSTAPSHEHSREHASGEGATTWTRSPPRIRARLYIDARYLQPVLTPTASSKNQACSSRWQPLPSLFTSKRARLTEAAEPQRSHSG